MILKRTWDSTETEKESEVLLTPFQAVFFYEWLINPSRVDYNMVIDHLLIGNIDIDRLNNSFIRFMNDHLLLSSNVCNSEHGLAWKKRTLINESDKLLIYFPFPSTTRQMEELVNKPFDLEKDLLVRYNLIKIKENQYRLIIVAAHLIVDGLSHDDFLNELSNYYNDVNYSSGVDLETQTALNKQLYLKLNDVIGRNKEAMKEFWQKTLINSSGSEIEFLNKRTSGNCNYKNIKNIRFSFGKDELADLKHIARIYGLTPYIYSKLVFAILLNKMTGKESIIISFPVAIPEGIKNIYGAHINTVFVKYQFGENTTVVDLIAQARDFYSEFKKTKAKYLPINEIMRFAQSNEILDVGFIQTNLQDYSIKYEGVESVEVNEELNFNLTSKLLIEQEIREDQINFRVRYYEDLLEESLVESILDGYKKLFFDLLKDLQLGDINKEVKKLSAISEGSLNKIIYGWNETDKDYPREKTIHQLFEEQVDRTPNNIAVIFEKRELTYKQLNERANQLAHYLKHQYNIEPNALIALCLDRSEHMLIAVLAVLKAGGAYVPVDPSYPVERIHYILEDTKAKVVLSNEVNSAKLKRITDKTGTFVELIDTHEFESILPDFTKSNPISLTSSSDLAYVIYTSGTTGQPKGAMLEHSGIVNRITWMNNAFPLNEQDRILQKTPYVFDVSVWELFWANWYGAAIVFARPEGHKDMEYLQNVIQSEMITVLHFVPSMLGAFESSLKTTGAEKVQGIKYLFCSGEALALAQVRDCHLLLPKTEIHNLYGPTEASVDVLFYNCNDKAISSVLIGRPIQNTSIYILDNNLQPVSIGAVGELFIGGDGVARGYLNRPDLTRERFIQNPFQTKAQKSLGRNKRIYKTGDLVRYLPDGNIEYLGRNDFQVKIRGFRIELGEIETQLTSVKGIKQSVVIAKEKDQNQFLVGYYVADQILDHQYISGELSHYLPEYMLPSVFVHLKELPLTINGKLNRKALPEPELVSIYHYVAPSNEIENALRGIFAEVLSLPIEKIGIEDDFFRLGGNSIMAIKLVNKISKKLEGKLKVVDLFQLKTISKLACHLSSAQTIVKIEKRNFTKQKDQILSFSQERLWFIEEYAGGTHAYNIPIVLRLKDDFNKESFVSALYSIVERHEILRSVIRTAEDGTGYQEVLPLRPDQLPIAEVDAVDKYDLEALISISVNHIFKLNEEYPLRMTFFKLGKENYASIVFHHIAFDGWSIDLFVKEFLHYYGKEEISFSHINSLGNLETGELPLQYKDYAIWQREYLTGEVLNKQLSYWKEKLKGFETLNLVTTHPRPAKISYEGADEVFTIGVNNSQSLRELAKLLGVSVYALLLSGFYLLLKGYSNQDDIVVGTPIANRHHKEVADLIGFFVNTLVVREKIIGTQKLKDFIIQVGESVLQAQLHQDLPFEKLVSELEVPQDPSKNPIFQVMFGVQSFGTAQTAETSHLFELYKGNCGYQVAKYDLTLMLDDSQDEITGSFNYATRLFDADTIKSFIATYKHILGQLAELQTEEEHEVIVSELDYLDKNSFQKVIREWNDTEQTYDKDKTIHELFEKQVEETPDNIAVIYEDKELSYKELNERANQLAHYLREDYKIQPDDLIALCLDRSEHMLIAILGVMKAGGAYVPMDPGYPKDRIAYTLEDTTAKVVLTNQVYKEKLAGLEGATAMLAIDEDDFQFRLSTYPTSNPISINKSTDLAYVIYTSGTTGKPKGAMLQHQGIINRIQWMHKEYPITENDIVLQKTPYVFDVSVWELFWANWCGATIVFARQDGHKDMDYLQDIIDSKKISVIHFVPSMLGIFEVALRNKGTAKAQSLKYLFCSGEALPLTMVKEIKELLPATQIHNLYGPTEASVDVLYYDCNDRNISHVLIGRPIDNTTLYVLNGNGNLVPVGAIGELYLGGDGVARGYLNKPELTAERFLANPFQTEEEKKKGRNGIIYKTGDLVRYHRDGNLEYLGRNDFQVKIRGFRIELGEIEARLSAIEGIQQSVVIVKDKEENKYLVGYYVSETEINHEKLIVELAGHLPEYMIPSAFVHLKELPININGKLDRKGLPDPQFSNTQTYLAPSTDTELSLAKIYSQVLGLQIEKISVGDDFFRLGGNSILAIKLVNRINKEVDDRIKVADLFQYKTISKLATYLQGAQPTIKIVAKVISKEEDQVLSFAQERLWFIEQYSGGSNVYNIPVVLRLKDGIDQKTLIAAIESIVERHEVLRTVLRMGVEGSTYQKVLDFEPLLISEEKASTREGLEELFTKSANYVFNLEEEYPIRVGFYQIQEEKYLSIVFHHIAFDGWSIDVFVRELLKLYSYYEALEKGEQTMAKEFILPALALQYKDYAVWQREYLKGEVLEQQLSFWREKLSGYENLNLAIDKARPNQISFAGADINFSIDKETSAALRKVSKELEVSMYSLLLSGFYVLLKGYSNQEDIVVGAPVANRHYKELEGLLGFFVNTLVLREEVKGELDIKSYIRKVSESVLQAQLYQDLPFEKLVAELGVEQDMSRNPIFQVMFGVQSFGREQAEEIGKLFEEYKGEAANEIARYDLTVMLDESRDEITGTFNYSTALFTAETIDAFISTFKHILSQLATLRDQSVKLKQVKDIDYLDSKQLKEVIYDWNSTEKEYPKDKTIKQLFEEQVERTPDQVALVYEDRKLTYQELNERANQLAYYLREEYHIQPDDVVGIMMERSEKMLVAMLGVLKSGGAYVPIAVNMPRERVEFIVGNAKVKGVLVDELPEIEETILQVHKTEYFSFKESWNLVDWTRKINPAHVSTSENLAYVLYTSGTTGNPKGVMVENRNIVNTLLWKIDYHQFNSSVVNLQIPNYSFDVSVEDIFAVLLSGGKLVLINEDLLLHPEYVKVLISQHKVTHFLAATSLYHALLDEIEPNYLRSITIGGERVEEDLVKQHYEKLSHVSLINEYGPTECAVTAAVYPLKAEGKILIGRPISNTSLYVLDENYKPLPIGATGELYISGAGVARGYLDGNQLTEEKFVPNPFKAGERMYKTGDLVRFLPDGNIQFLTRNDFQVKIRGLRIELGEIEMKLRSLPGVDQSVVQIKEKGKDKYLIGYYVSNEEISVEELKNQLGKKLPDHMVPGFFVHLKKLPLTTNGKVDRKALPLPDFNGSKKKEVLATTATEVLLSDILSDHLGMSQISINENFFQLGLHSLSVIKLNKVINDRLQIELPVNVLFKFNTIEELASYIDYTHSEKEDNSEYEVIIEL